MTTVEMAREIVREMAESPALSLDELAARTGRAADIIASTLKLDKKLIVEARRALSTGDLLPSNAYLLAKYEASEQHIKLKDAMRMMPSEFAPHVFEHLKKLKTSKLKSTVLVVLVDELGETYLVTLKLAGAELEMVLDMHGTVLSVTEMNTKEQLVHNYFFTRNGTWKHKHTKKRITGKFDHAIVIYRDRSR